MQSLLEVVSENVRFYRKRTGLSQLKTAYQLGMSPSYLAEIERGTQYPSLKVLERLAAYFKVEPYQLLYPTDGGASVQVPADSVSILRDLQQQMNALFEEKYTALK